MDGLGFRGFWMGYFAGRAAPFGAVGPDLVTATFFNFHPSRAARVLPDAWGLRVTRRRLGHADPRGGVHAAPGRSRRWRRRPGPCVPGLRRLLDGVPAAGRPLFAATRAQGEPDDPVEALWYWCTCLREHRGDGHVAALTTAGLDGCEALVLFAAAGGPAGRSAAAVAGVVRGRVGLRRRAPGAARPARRRGGDTPAGDELRRWVEATTDDLAGMVTGRVQGADAEALHRGLSAVAGAVRSAGVLTYPNPMGLPEPR